MAEKRTEANGKGEKERYTDLNAKFQRIAEEIRKTSSVINTKKRRKTIEWKRTENSSRKFRDTKGTFHAKMGSIKDRNCKGPNRSRRYEEMVVRINRRTIQK